MRRIPYAAVFEMTPDRTAATSGGASRYASGEPAVEGPDGRLDDERRHEPEEDPRVVARRPGHVERAAREAESDDGDEHQERARHRVDDELDRRARPSRSTPHADEDVERDQHCLPEDVEEQEVLRGEHADRGALEKEQEAHVGSGALAAGPEAVPDGRRRDDRGQPDEPERVVEEADLVRDPQVVEPTVSASN